MPISSPTNSYGRVHDWKQENTKTREKIDEAQTQGKEE
jgi:hypothetical protein